MIYIFPIFLFGCVVTGVVFLGIVEATDQLKRANASRKLSDLTRDDPKPANNSRVGLKHSTTT